MKKIALLVAATALVLSACAGTPEVQHSKKDAEGAIMAAEHANKRVAKVGHEWKYTGKFIKKAKAAMKKGDFNGAVKTANKAKREAVNAYKQYEDQKNAGPSF